MDTGASFDLSGKRVLVTGGTRGIGREIALAMRRHGAEVLITGTGERGEAMDGFAYRRLDLCDPDTIEALADGFDALDVLVNNAGLLFREDLFGSYRMCHAFHPHLVASHGAVVNVVSMRALVGAAGTPAYGAAKAGLLNLTRSLAVKWGPEGIRVNAVAPGPIETDMNATFREDAAAARTITEKIPLGRWGRSDEVAGAVVYLASPAAAFTTGACQQTDGGILA